MRPTTTRPMTRAATVRPKTKPGTADSGKGCMGLVRNVEPEGKRLSAVPALTDIGRGGLKLPSGAMWRGSRHSRVRGLSAGLSARLQISAQEPHDRAIRAAEPINPRSFRADPAL